MACSSVVRLLNGQNTLKRLYRYVNKSQRLTHHTIAIQPLNNYLSNSSAKTCSSLLKNDGKCINRKSLRSKSTAAPAVCHTATDLVPVSLPGGDLETFHPVWLRENCRCPACYTHSTEQRNILAHTVDAEIKSMKQDQQELHIEWNDGHQSAYPLQWLQTFSHSETRGMDIHLWDSVSIQNSDVQPVSYPEVMESDQGLTKLLHNVWRWGFGLVQDSPVSEEATENMATRVAFIQETLFGRHWTFSADLARGDTAYTNIALGAHTDNTYLTAPAGIQVFHCLHHDGEGGETLLVDGFHAAEQLRAQDPEAFHTLAHTRLIHEYREPNKGIHVNSLDSVLSVHPGDGSLQRIRYNHYDRAPIDTVTQRHVGAVYDALQKLSAKIECPSNEHWLKLHPGTVLFVDNWRVLHGRAAFTGNRKVTGCYLPRDDWLSAARRMGVL